MPLLVILATEILLDNRSAAGYIGVISIFIPLFPAAEANIVLVASFIKASRVALLPVLEKDMLVTSAPLLIAYRMAAVVPALSPVVNIRMGIILTLGAKPDTFILSY
ncbi:Uncharacterised protein [Listeria booriae]|nr:Uncharacterised protein [Listeria booriae]